jgi:hypothetical protein
MSKRSKYKYALIALLSVFALGLIALVVNVATYKPALATLPESTTTSSSASKLVLDGIWTDDDDKFTATVKNNAITIIWKLDATSNGLYWVGDFQSQITEGTGFNTIISTADRTKLETSIVGSQDSTKAFAHQDGKLSFEFGAMGVTKTVVLSKK